MGPKALLIAACLAAAPASPAGLRAELRRLGVDTALVLPSQAIDDFPIWSPDSRFVAANVMDTWYQVDLQRIRLGQAKWHRDQPLGVIEGEEAVTPLPPALLQAWKPKVHPSTDVAEAGALRFEFQRKEMSTALLLTRRGQAPKVAWRTELDTCGNPVASPDGKLVAFLCEGNGLFVMVVE